MRQLTHRPLFYISFMILWIPYAQQMAIGEPVQWSVEDGGNDHYYELIQAGRTLL